MEDLISVIVPIYRVEEYLEECIQSIRNQTYKNLEIILVDDGSDDGCPQICDYHAKADKRVKVIHKKNGKSDSARKAGMSIATGKYVGYVDGDDWIEPVMYERLIGYIHKYDVDVVESGVVDFGVDGERKRIPYIEEGCYKGQDFIKKVEPRLLYAGVFFEHGISPYLVTKLFLKEKIEKYQMIEDVTCARQVDTMVALPCIADAKEVYISHDCYYHYRVRSNSLKREWREKEVEYLFECYPEFYERFKGTRLCLESDKQIKYFTMYWLIQKAPYVFDDLDTGVFLTPFGGLDITTPIVLYGAGAAGIHIEKYIRSVKNSNIICWTDRNYEGLCDTLGVISPREIISFDYDYVIISILRESTVQSAKRDLINLGVLEEKILWIDQKYIDDPDLLLRKVVWQGKKLI